MAEYSKENRPTAIQACSNVSIDDQPLAVGDDSTGELNLRSGSTLLGAFFAFFCSVGFINAWGIFQEYYFAALLSSYSEFDISWIGSFTVCAMYLTSPVVGIIYDKSGPNVLLCIGGIGTSFSIFMTSLCREYYQFFLAQSLLLGVSLAFLITPSLSTITKYFNKNRALAMGIVVAGSSTGGIIWPVVLDQLLNHTSIGFGWTVRIIGFIMLPLLTVSCLIVRLPQKSIDSTESIADSEPKPPVQKQKTDLSIVKNPAFLLICAGLGICNLGMFSPFFYVSSYASSLHMSTSFSFYLISIVNGASFVGRVLPGILADRYGPFNLLFSAAMASGIVAFTWTTATSIAGVTVWSLAYGFASGAIMSLQSACVSRLATPQTMGTAMGVGMGSIALMTLFGTPISGQLVGQYGYLALSMFAGTTLVTGSMLIAASRFLQDRRLLAVK